ncbi:hypothetical protein CR513_20218, partial [Mucuna pruriens]
MSVKTLRSDKELPQQQIVNLHFEFPDFDDFIDCDCTCIGLIEFLIYEERGGSLTNETTIEATEPPFLMW